MLQIIDNTLMAPFDFPGQEEIYRLCDMLFIIGVDVVELPASVYRQMSCLPTGKYLLHVADAQEAHEYPGFYRYISQQELDLEPSILEVQMNDIREIISLKRYRNHKEIRITGMDDLLCHSYEKLIPEILASLPKSTIHFCPENTYHCATALAVQWLVEYGKNVTTSFAGCKNNAATEEVLMTLRLAIRHKPNRDLTILPELTYLYEKIFGTRIGNRKAIVGKNIFKVEAGIHADGLHKNPVTYEAFSPTSVGGKSELVIGKHSGSRAVKIKMEQLQLPFPSDETIERLLTEIGCQCMKNRRSLSDEEFARLLKEVIADERDQAYC